MRYSIPLQAPTTSAIYGEERSLSVLRDAYCYGCGRICGIARDDILEWFEDM